jgi:hypothetical protein
MEQQPYKGKRLIFVVDDGRTKEIKKSQLKINRRIRKESKIMMKNENIKNAANGERLQYNN